MHKRWMTFWAVGCLVCSGGSEAAQEPLERARNCAPAIDPQTSLEYPQCPRRRADGTITASDLAIYDIEIDGYERKVRVLFNDKLIGRTERDHSRDAVRESRADLKALRKEESNRDRE